jgi:hypothetical protein
MNPDTVISNPRIREAGRERRRSFITVPLYIIIQFFDPAINRFEGWASMQICRKGEFHDGFFDSVSPWTIVS